jgi:hypothetical protein
MITTKHNLLKIYRYQNFMITDTLKSEPRFRSCLRMNCPSGQIHEAGDAEPLMTCGMCGYKMCYVHSRPWHEGQTCTEYENTQRQSAENQASVELIVQLSKACPGRECGVPIEKNRGCDHMTCKSIDLNRCDITDKAILRLQLQARVLLAMPRSLRSN